MVSENFQTTGCTIGPGDDSVIAFTPLGIGNLQALILMNRDLER